MPYKRINDYGLIGDMNSAALVGTDGSIDWCCFPRFDSPSVFAAMLDAEKGGAIPDRPCGTGPERGPELPAQYQHTLDTIHHVDG